MRTLAQLFNRDRFRTVSRVGKVNAAFGKGKAGAGDRASVEEQHHQNLAQVMGHFRELGHKISDVSHTDKKKLPLGMARSVIKHRSGKHKLRTVVRTQFNTEGGDHNKTIETGPDEE